MTGLICSKIEKHFLLIAIVLSVAAYIHPPLFIWIKPHIALCLGIIMFGMGLTLEVGDFLAAFKSWRTVGLGVLLQYTIMPLLAVGLSSLLSLPPDAVIGMVVVGSCPGGTASNVISHIAKANVALSVTITLVSTCLAPILTPAVIYLVLNQRVEIAFLPMVESVFWIVVFPLVDGLVIRRILRRHIDSVVYVFPSISIIVISMLIACIMGLNHDMLSTFPVLVFIAVALHNLGGLALGYGAARLARLSHKDSITLAIEVGMQNSGLGVALASKYFTAASALPGAVFSLWHNISGVCLANRFRRVVEAEKTAD
ncbi:bile acid:sodium symporter family protein [Maridesulfovibrio bastinii]|jgi:BASS family bile acid:Na+ symporter|uniref:bile acid:sodium symporter family protein n=1 Tax=Maridesulfovibrio bastinii TaxID=47157 RepID=UPI0003FB616E|nr:bile acid:sodium symporter family protein [Maridesulfovibrio bastinii]